MTTPRASPPTRSRTGPGRARRGRCSSEAFRDFQEIGFTAVKADVPEGMTAGRVPRLDRRLRPGAVAQPVQLRRSTRRSTWPRRSSGPSGSPPTRSALGLDRTMISSMAVPARMARPAVGAGLRRGPAGPRHRELRRGLPGAAGRGAAPAAPLARRRRLRDRGRDRPAARRPRARRHRGRAGHRAPALGRHRPGAVHPRGTPTGSVASTSRTASPTSSTPASRARPELPRAGRTRSGCGPSPACGVVDFDAVLAAAARGLRRRLHDRGRRAERRVEAGVAPDLVRVGPAQPSGAGSDDGVDRTTARSRRGRGPDADRARGRRVRRRAAGRHRRRRAQRLRPRPRRDPHLPAAAADRRGARRPARPRVPADRADRAGHPRAR